MTSDQTAPTGWDRVDAAEVGFDPQDVCRATRRREASACSCRALNGSYAQVVSLEDYLDDAS